ncbi:hypothetical protein CRM22_005073 [Opisthorchis felineus]|uniref:Uncharacterized protein n=1 Tax=Opisthorchis felineus TaxID=147828 RepID=A0A4V3SF34_OPIFE|nr:hypothetical protein CRM22_005073 [Opisthorchis felineus]
MCAFTEVRQTDLPEEWQEVLLEMILDTALSRCPVGRKKSRLAVKLRTMYCGDWKVHVSRDVPELLIHLRLHDAFWEYL